VVNMAMRQLVRQLWTGIAAATVAGLLSAVITRLLMRAVAHLVNGDSSIQSWWLSVHCAGVYRVPAPGLPRSRLFSGPLAVDPIFRRLCLIDIRSRRNRSRGDQRRPRHDARTLAPACSRVNGDDRHFCGSIRYRGPVGSSLSRYGRDRRQLSHAAIPSPFALRARVTSTG
jgi:hypothetical protein